MGVEFGVCGSRYSQPEPVILEAIEKSDQPLKMWSADITVEDEQDSFREKDLKAKCTTNERMEQRDNGN